MIVEVRDVSGSVGAVRPKGPLAVDLTPPLVLDPPVLSPLDSTSLICGLAESSLIRCFAGPLSLSPLNLTRHERFQSSGPQENDCTNNAQPEFRTPAIQEAAVYTRYICAEDQTVSTNGDRAQPASHFSPPWKRKRRCMHAHPKTFFTGGAMKLLGSCCCCM